MIKVKQLYVLWTSDEGDKKLIPKEEYESFISELSELESELGFPLGGWDDREKDEVQQDIYDLIDQHDTLEGEEIYVVLKDDVIEGDKD